MALPLHRWRNAMFAWLLQRMGSDRQRLKDTLDGKQVEPEQPVEGVTANAMGATPKPVPRPHTAEEEAQSFRQFLTATA